MTENIALNILCLEIARVVRLLPFGEHPALPWCRESFKKLDLLMKQFEEIDPPHQSKGVML